MVPISKRMKTIADMVPVGLSVADIGCDHGFVSIYLVNHRQAPYAIAMDVNEGPLQKAKEHIEQFGLSDVIQIRLSDGAKQLSVGEAEAAVIAGLGGRLMVRILEDSMEVFKNMTSLVLSPHSDISFVREYLITNGFVISDEEMIFDEGKYYTVMRCSYAMDGIRDNVITNPVELEYGPMLIKKKHPVLIEYLGHECRKLTEIKERLATDESHKERVKELDEKISNISKLLEIM